MPTVDLLLTGQPVQMTKGIIGFCSVALVTGEKRTLVDVGHVGLRTNLIASLEERGLTPQDIDATVMSHAHWDHNQNFDVFDHAPVLMHPWERAYAQRPHANDWATPQWTGAMLETQSKIETVEDGYEIEPGVRVLHTPGHSPGSLTVMVDTDDGVAALTGDVLHFASVALTRHNPLVFWDSQQADESIERILGQSDIIYPGHDRPFRLTSDGEAVEYVAPLDIQFYGVDFSDPGVRFDGQPPEPWVMPGIEQQRIDL